MYYLIGGLVIVCVTAIYFYNRIVTLVNMKKEAESGIYVQLKRRYDLVPNLITTVKGYAGHEKGVFEKVAEVRSECLKINSVSDKVELENRLGAGIDRLIMIAENYPELKAGENFLKLQQQLAEVEDNIQYSRRYFNGVVRDYNNAVETFPGLLVAKGFKFGRAEFYELKNASEREAVVAEFSGGKNE